ncbi:MAG: CehA/McbA family metallohydrolase [Nitrososphaerota archaeon]|jgi:predicted metal-dependent phosphoesterase TrpH|uniref:CehA/McbA family metallohydrolase n=1 Tax=Candidatus Bathycorpusculum sp. TaxID=2994959 RepID=UPI00281FC163|nr:CehA/McbA family metallohydrolase [Candidatus Termiticorpusculum sp.]MCL2257129.1 CehA/McbA family metallohydrolase [Candidatus Termiticorpusculum sp.]MCL2292730.1 CehA/McbA family metallohydrolase [Candidatus Termiticorpusculum sp.]MDR0459901.1 CehA/McbA family metallohydrolase [Nitrososphaerota archaeon]
MTIQIRADLHVHTTYSNDSFITPKELVFYAKKKGLNAVAVTDHDYWEGAVKIAKEVKDFLVIPGMEVSSSEGHIVALNIKKFIPQGLTAVETVEHIHNAGGVAIACHPYVYFKGCLRNAVCDVFDAIEVINARAFPFKSSVKKAMDAAEKFKLSQVAGTDAHYGPQIGFGYTIIDVEEATVEAVTKAIVAGHCQAHGQQVPIVLNVQQQIQRLKRMVKKTAAELS